MQQEKKTTKEELHHDERVFNKEISTQKADCEKFKCDEEKISKMKLGCKAMGEGIDERNLLILRNFFGKRKLDNCEY